MGYLAVRRSLMDDCEKTSEKITSVTPAIDSSLEDVEKQGKIQTTRHIPFNSSG